MKIVVLGSAGFIPTTGKETMCVLVVTDNQNAFLFDAGSGVTNLINKKIIELLSNITTLNVMLSHFHHDHTSGLTWLLKLWKGSINIYIPTHPLVNFNGSEAINILTSNPFFDLNISNWPNCKSITPLTENKTTKGETGIIDSANYIVAYDDGMGTGYQDCLDDGLDLGYTVEELTKKI